MPIATYDTQRLSAQMWLRYGLRGTEKMRVMSPSENSEYRIGRSLLSQMTIWGG